jgi:hypothetical protein
VKRALPSEAPAKAPITNRPTDLVSSEIKTNPDTTNAIVRALESDPEPTPTQRGRGRSRTVSDPPTAPRRAINSAARERGG